MAADIVSRDPVAVRDDAPLDAVAQLIARHRVGCVPFTAFVLPRPAEARRPAAPDRGPGHHDVSVVTRPAIPHVLPGPRQTKAPRTGPGSGVVLVALDGSPTAARALPLARALALQLGARVEGLHVVDAETAGADPAALVPRQLEGREAARILAAGADPAGAIVHAAREPWVELVVLTTAGRTPASRHRLGHVARRVLAHTRRPVLLVRPNRAPAGAACVAPLRRLLLPLDGSPMTTAALRPALDLAARLDAALDILLVAPHPGPATPEPGGVTPPRYVDQPHHEWADWRGRVLGHLAAHVGPPPGNVTVRVVLTAGDIAHQIGAFAAEHHADAIVLVRRSHLEAGRARVLRAVLGRTVCPILLLAAEPPAAAHAEPTAARRDAPAHAPAAGAGAAVRARRRPRRSGA
jgi:nucleotide-binding universal stress UspA family protein